MIALNKNTDFNTIGEYCNRFFPLQAIFPRLAGRNAVKIRINNRKLDIGIFSGLLKERKKRESFERTLKLYAFLNDTNYDIIFEGCFYYRNREKLMNIRYAISTMVFWWRETNLSFEMECEYLKNLGFGVELWPNIKGQTECRYRRHNWDRLADVTKDMLVLMRSRDDKPTLEQWKEQMDCAKLLDADMVANLKSLGLENSPEINGCDFASEIVGLAEDLDVKLCIETGDLSKLKQLGEKFDSIHYCLDTGYANLDKNYGFKNYVDDLAERIACLHLSDNYGTKDDHEPPGLQEGISRENWDYLLNALSKYDNRITATLEMFPSMPNVMIRQGCEFLFDTLNWPDRPQQKPSQVRIYNPV